jgi:formylglycine-generating enzyme required for sulfatase activity
LDEEDLLPGQKWQREIPKAVRASDVVIVCLSQAALNKAGYVQEEIKFALDIADQQPEEAIFLIPVRLEACDVPERLQGLHWVNLYDERGYGRLIRALQEKAKAEAEAKPAAAEKTSAKSKPKIPGDAYVSVANDEEAIEFYWQHLSRGGLETEPGEKSAEPQTLPRHFDFEPEMILIPAGEFLMGSDPKKDKQAQENEQPQHTLYLPDYYMAKTPVTNAQYAAFVQATGYRSPRISEDWAKSYNWRGQTPPKGKENHPVVLVNWDDAVTYSRWLAEIVGKPYRLPSEAEWEKGARGTDGRVYPWGNKWDVKRCNSHESGGTIPVDTYPNGASPYGLLDMAGNVWEWCSTIWQESAYPFQVKDEWAEAYLSRTDVPRVVRGGVFYGNYRFVRCAIRYRVGPYRWNDKFGFRVMVSPF